MAVAALAGLAVAALAAGPMMASPLSALADVVARWTNGEGFDALACPTAPAEVAALAQVFSEATAALTRHEAQVRDAVAQQELAMQEIHHRVKNNLQIVASLLNLQANRIRLPEAKAEFQAARDRIRALATLHRHLYAEREMHTINMRDFLTELCGQLFQAMGEREGQRISLTIEASELEMSSDQAVPLALIVTEAVSNAVKYAFPGGRRGRIGVSLTAVDGTAHLRLEDDGVGIPEGQGESETGPRDGLGIQLIRGFARQLGATLQVSDGGGTGYELAIPLRRERLVSAADPEFSPTVADDPPVAALKT